MKSFVVREVNQYKCEKCGKEVSGTEMVKSKGMWLCNPCSSKSAKKK